MKKLQLKDSAIATHFSVNVENIDTIVYSDGFSGYKIGKDGLQSFSSKGGNLWMWI